MAPNVFVVTKDTPVRAYNCRTKVWYWSVLSWPGPNDNNVVSAFRVDALPGDDLEDFECWAVDHVNGNKFRPIAKLTSLIAVYS